MRLARKHASTQARAQALKHASSCTANTDTTLSGCGQSVTTVTAALATVADSTQVKGSNEDRTTDRVTHPRRARCAADAVGRPVLVLRAKRLRSAGPHVCGS